MTPCWPVKPLPGRHDDFSPATGNGLMLWGVMNDAPTGLSSGTGGVMNDGPTGLSSGTESVMMIFHPPPVMASCCGAS